MLVILAGSPACARCIAALVPEVEGEAHKRSKSTYAFGTRPTQHCQHCHPTWRVVATVSPPITPVHPEGAARPSLVPRSDPDTSSGTYRSVSMSCARPHRSSAADHPREPDPPRATSPPSGSLAAPCQADTPRGGRPPAAPGVLCLPGAASRRPTPLLKTIRPYGSPRCDRLAWRRRLSRAREEK